jgi:signal transduction histidine kinase
LGLAAAAEGFCRELAARQQVEIYCQSEGIPADLPEVVSLSLCRVLQEALQNAVKHSGSRHIEVSLCCVPNEIRLTVRDGGAGFNPSEAMKGSGLGRISMKERLKLVNGEFSIESKPQHGAIIRAWVPIATKEKSTATS